MRDSLKANGLTDMLYIVTLIAITILGAIGMFFRLKDGEITELTNIVPWGLWVAGYIYLMGLSVGGYLFSTLVYVFRLKQFEKVGRIALLQALACLMGSIVLIFLDLGHSFRSLALAVWFNPTSVMAWMFIGYNVYFLIVASSLFLVFQMDKSPAAARGKIAAWLKSIGIVGIPTAVFVHGGVSSIFATVKAHPVWATGLLPILFLISAIVSGTSFLAVLTYYYYKSRNPREEEEKRQLVIRIGKLALIVLFAEMLSLISEFLVVLYGGVPHHAMAYDLVMSGPLWYLFWFGQVGIGLVFPFFVLLNPMLNKNHKAIMLACIGALIGILFVRINIVIPTLLIPNFDTLAASYPHSKYMAFYFPNYKEWFVLLAALALSGWLFEIGRRIIPLQAPAAAEGE